MWLMEAIHERSCDMMVRAFTMASRCGISMDSFLDAQGTADAPAGSMASFAPLLFAPRHAQPPMITTPVDVSELSLDLCAAIGRTRATMNEGWVFVRVYSRGTVRFFFSPAFERDITSRKHAKGNEDPVRATRPGIEFMIPPSECPKCLHAVGMQVQGHTHLELLCSPCH
jgi:hypothetical protein